MIGPVRRRVSFWTGVLLLSSSALFWLLIVSLALEEPQDLSDLIIAASVMTAAGLWTLLVGRAGRGLQVRKVPSQVSSSQGTVAPPAFTLTSKRERLRAEKTLAGFDEVIERRGDATDHGSLVEVAETLVAKVVVLEVLDRPGDLVTRGQMAAFLVRALGYTDNGGGDLFIDDDGSVFENDIDKLATAGVTRGCNPPLNDEFCPTDFVTRGQMAAFLHRALGS